MHTGFLRRLLRRDAKLAQYVLRSGSAVSVRPFLQPSVCHTPADYIHIYWTHQLADRQLADK